MPAGIMMSLWLWMPSARFLTDPLSMRDLHIDVLVLSSQKGLNLPPGLSFVVLSDRVLAKNSFAPGGYYYDWDTHLRNMKRGQTPYSPATQLFRQLHARLKKLEKSGVERAIDAVKNPGHCFPCGLPREWVAAVCR
jgi:aspartate aminotransferase-like enzyme